MRVALAVLLALCVAFVSGLATKATSCVGRCGDNDGTSGCQCNAVCTEFGDCCSDYEAVCNTCADRCGDPYVSSAPCHCNDECGSHGNCCSDYDDICDGSSGGSVTDQDILDLSEELTGLDANNLGASVVVDRQGQTSNSATDDAAPAPLFVTVPELSTGTYPLFLALRDNYAPSVSVAEDDTPAEQAEVAAFLDAALATPLMQRLDAFMTEKQILTGTLRENIEEIWFTLFSRSGSTLGSTGFEHSFMGELDGGVSGFHNWVSFYEEEQAGNIDYKGYIEYVELGTSGQVLTDRFTWYDSNKPIGGYFVGTSPEFELAIYTLCFFTRPNSQCQVQSNGIGYYIQTYELASGGLTLVGSAYPGVN